MQTNSDSAINRIRSSNTGTGGVRCGSSATVRIRSNRVATGGVVCGSSAIVVSVDSITYGTGTGGVVCSGTDFNEINSLASGGVVQSGTAIVNIESSITATGGTVCGGFSLYLKVANTSSIGGINISGTSKSNVRLTPEVSGGTICSGKTLISESVYIGGGIVIGGFAVKKSIFNLSGRQGIVISGSGRQTFIDYVLGTGGIRIGGQSKIERRKHVYERLVSGMIRTILAEAPLPPKNTINRPSYTVPIFIQNNPRDNSNDVWGKLGETYEGVLPNIVPINQKGFVPIPKKKNRKTI